MSQNSLRYSCSCGKSGLVLSITGRIQVGGISGSREVGRGILSVKIVNYNVMCVDYIGRKVVTKTSSSKGLGGFERSRTAFQLEELFSNDWLPLQTLKGPDCLIGKLVDCRTVGEFYREVCDRKAFGYPNTFGRAVEMVTSVGLDPVRCLELGMSELKYFPYISYWDEKCNLKAKWNWKDFVELHQPNQVPSVVSRAAAYRGVCKNRGI
ncbi:hypothetical protein Q8A67_010411 [Cirrhinus molitorella]|uniref:Uncharacterized protein n=1 Tax=Cirrhinus molitorella TaxID=172907 RepID=A0AA88PTP3_9TELE|nr:hypothetical protein Q8A67_010411 [Cirrhinus molitorella]